MATPRGATETEAPALRHVVVPVDDTEDSARAVTFAQNLAAGLELPLTVISVIDSFRSAATTRVETLRRHLGDLPDDVTHAVVQATSPARAIAAESADGIVVMATTAQQFDSDGIRSSVAEFVVNASTSPVVVLGPRCPTDVAADRITVGIDPSHDQRGLTSWTTRLGYQLEMPVDFVHVGGDGNSDLGPKVRRLEVSGTESVAQRLLAEADGALLAIGSHGHLGLTRLSQGSVGASLFREATQPVMVLGPEARS